MKQENELKGITPLNGTVILEMPTKTASGILLNTDVNKYQGVFKVVAVASDVESINVGDFVLGAGSVMPLTVKQNDIKTEYAQVYKSAIYTIIDKNLVDDAYFGTIESGHND
jgi:ABC-type molybdate transport system ATPase subunit